MKKCIDISAWQDKVSVSGFEKVKASGVECIIIRSSYTTQKSFSLHEDKVFENNILNAYKAGLKIGVYHYSQATTVEEGRKEAQYCIHLISRFKNLITLPIAFDWEFGYRLSAYIAKKRGKEGCGKICDAFCNTIKDAGYDVMVYANLSTLNAYLPSDLYTRWKIWVAQYHTRCDYKHPYYMWQYSSSGKVPGISGRIDMNNLYGEGSDPKPSKPQQYTGEFPTLPRRGWFSSGDKGAQVKKLQRFLNWYGQYGLVVDGVVGRKTINAVKYYQGREKLKVDGAFGKESLARAKIVKR